VLQIVGQKRQNVNLDQNTEKVLVVDDEPSIRKLLAEFLSSRGYACETAESGEDAVERLRSDGFALVISDIRMPRLTGLQLLNHLRQYHPNTAVIMITAVSELQTAVDAMKKGASDYITKPFNLEEVLASVKGSLSARNDRLRERQLKENLKKIVESKSFALGSALKTLENQRDTTLEALVKALDAREKETRCHSLRVQRYSLRLAKVFDLSEQELTNLSRGALLHDIGKIGVSDAILLKPGKLTPEEWVEMKKHPVLGYNILVGIQFLEGAAELVLHHHERWDGNGYPAGLKGRRIPLGARLFSVVDTFDAMTSNRPYRAALSPDFSRDEIARQSGSQFDPEVVKAFLTIPQEELDLISRECSLEAAYEIRFSEWVFSV